MFKKFLLILIVFVIIISGCSQSRDKSSEKSDSDFDSDYDPNIVREVDFLDFVARPTSFRGKINFSAYVQAIDEKSFLFRITSEEEYREYGPNPNRTNANLVTIYIPDSTKPDGNTPSDFTYDIKEFPQIGDKLTIEGEIKKRGEVYTVEVDKIIKNSETIVIKQ